MRRRRKAEINVPVASMGDIAFLLIIFFMVCSRFAREAGIDVTLPTSPHVAELEEGAITVAIDARGDIYVQGSKVPDAKSVESKIRDLVEGKTSPQARRVIFRCDATVLKDVFEPVLEAIAEGGGELAATGTLADEEQ